MSIAEREETVAMTMTQKDRVRNALGRAPDGVCARWFVYEAYPGIPRAAARISDLRAEGLDIRTEPCDLHLGLDPQAHHVKYRLVQAKRYKAKPDSMLNPSIGRTDLATWAAENRAARRLW